MNKSKKSEGGERGSPHTSFRKTEAYQLFVNVDHDALILLGGSCDSPHDLALVTLTIPNEHILVLHKWPGGVDHRGRCDGKG